MSTVAIVRGNQLMFWCPGCDQLHGVDITQWEWDGDLIAPTVNPSILTQGSVHMCPKTYVHYELCEDPLNCQQRAHVAVGNDQLGHMKPHIAEPAYGNCHAFLRNGQWQFLGDSVHKLAGQNAQMVELPEWLLP